MRFTEKFSIPSNYSVLPAFAKFLLDGHLDGFSKEQLSLSHEVNLPLLKLLKHLGDEQLFAITRISMVEYLTFLSENRTGEFIKLSLDRWVTDQLEVIGKFEVLAEDITLINFIRGKAFRKFIPIFTDDLKVSLALVDELDTFLTASTTASTNTYIMLLKDQLSRNENDLLEAQRIARIGSFEMNLVTNKTTNSPELYKIFEIKEGTKFDEFIQYVHPEDRPGVIAEMKKAEKGGMYEKEYRYFKNGKIKYIWSKGIYIYENGKPVKFIGTIQDITERKKVEQELIDKTIALERSNDSLQQFAFAASHDLKEPIRKISTYSDIVLTSNETLSEKSFANLRKIHVSALRMRQMIEDIMNYSEVLQQQEAEETNLGDLIESVLEILEEKIRETNAVIRFKDMPDVKVVTSRFRTLFQNLISNSIKFAKAETVPEIEITSKWLTAAEVKGRNLVAAPRYLQVSVKDNGIGFKQEFADRIFTLFGRLHSKSEYEGSGIGLAISQRVIESHNGVLFASSGENKGSVFTFIIPQ